MTNTVHPVSELARQKELEARTIDYVNPGEEQNERDHKLQGERHSAGDFGGRKWRHAPGGWFSWKVKVLPGQPFWSASLPLRTPRL